MATQTQDLEALKYPIGKFTRKEHYEFEEIEECVDQIMRLPIDLERALKGITIAELDTPYRPDGWTVRQVVHHLADSHMNAFCRIKLVLTEESPTIRPYDENAWSAMSDNCELPIEASMQIIKGVHQRICYMLHELNEEDLKRTYFHPEHQKTFDLGYLIALYAWHGKHHLGHVRLVVGL